MQENAFSLTLLCLHPGSNAVSNPVRGSCTGDWDIWKQAVFCKLALTFDTKK